MVSRFRRALPVFLFLFLAGCVPTSLAVPTASAMPILSPTANASPTSTFLPPPTRIPPIPLPTSILPPAPGGKLHWPVENARDLKQQIKDAQVIVVRISNFLFCPPYYDDQGKIDQQVCTDLEFELGKEQRQRLIEAIDENETQAGEIPEDLQGGGDTPLFALPYPEFSVSLILPKFRLGIHWATERSFRVGQIYYPNLSQNVWDLSAQLSNGKGEVMGFVQEKPALYQAVKALLPTITFPPEYLASLLAYERVVAAFDGKQCAYGDGNDYFPSFRHFIYVLLYKSAPLEESRPSGQPRMVFTFWVRGQAYLLETWKDGRFFYQGKTYKYMTKPLEPSVMEDVLAGLNTNECTPPQ